MAHQHKEGIAQLQVWQSICSISHGTLLLTDILRAIDRRVRRQRWKKKKALTALELVLLAALSPRIIFSAPHVELQGVVRRPKDVWEGMKVLNRPFFWRLGSRAEEKEEHKPTSQPDLSLCLCLSQW
jgi:hypothetical protein